MLAARAPFQTSDPRINKIMSSCCFWALSVRPFATRRRWEMSARPRESASVRVRVLNEDLGGRHRLEMVAEAPVLRAARLRLSLPLRPEPRSRQLSVSRPPNPLASVPSSQGSLYCTHGDVWPGWASPQSACWPRPRWWLLPMSPMCIHGCERPRMHPRRSSPPPRVLRSGSLAGCQGAAPRAQPRSWPRSSRQDARHPRLLG